MIFTFYFAAYHERPYTTASLQLYVLPLTPLTLHCSPVTTTIVRCFPLLFLSLSLSQSLCTHIHMLYCMSPYKYVLMYISQYHTPSQEADISHTITTPTTQLHHVVDARATSSLTVHGAKISLQFLSLSLAKIYTHTHIHKFIYIVDIYNVGLHAYNACM